MSMHRTLLFGAATLVVASAYLIYAEVSSPVVNGDQVEVPVVEPDTLANKGKPVAILKGEAAPAKPKKKMDMAPDPRRRLKLPDGSTMPILNGAVGAPAMSWPNDRPWSPIIDKMTDKNTGDEWYVHQDGSRTTTVNRYHTHTGRFGPVTQVANPTKAVPLSPDEVVDPPKPKKD